MNNNRFNSLLPNHINRPAQEVLHTPDLVDQLFHVRYIAQENIGEDGGLKLNHSSKTNEDYFSFSAQFLYHGEMLSTRIVVPGVLADRALAAGLKKGSMVRCTGRFGKDWKGVKPFYVSSFNTVKAGEEQEPSLPVQQEA